MARLLEVLVALVMVFVLAVIVALFLPASGHIQRSVTVSQGITHVYDLLNNFRRFPHYSVLTAYDSHIVYTQSAGDWYGPGAGIDWTSTNPKIGDGALKIVSATPGFNKVGVTGEGTIVWALTNQWRGHDKRFSIHLERTGTRGNLVKITWAYDVSYGWNLLNRYAGLYIHGRPGAFIHHSLKRLQDMLASIPTIDYAGVGGGDPLDPAIVATLAQPVLFVNTSAPRNLTDLRTATRAAMHTLDAAMKKLGVRQVGPRIRFTTDYGARKVEYSVAVPINTDTLTIDGHRHALTAPPVAARPHAAPASAGSSAGSASVAAAPVATAPAGPVSPAARDAKGAVVVNAKVRGMLAFGGQALEAVCYGSPACVPITRLRLQTYAQTHGYPFDPASRRLYDKQIAAPGSPGANGKPLAFNQQIFHVYLPLSAAPQQTPEQAAGLRLPLPAYAASVPAA